MNEHKYTASQMWEAANISAASYHQWRSRGFIKSKYKTEGSGKPQLYSLGEVFQVAVLSRLVSLGVSVSVAEMHIQHLWQFFDSKAYLVIRAYDLENDGINLKESSPTIGTIVRERDLSAELAKTEGAAVISLDKIEARVKKALEP